MTWLVRNPSFGLATAPDWELPEEDEVLAPLATLGATRVGSLAPPPSSAPPAVARSATVGPSLSGPPPHCCQQAHNIKVQQTLHFLLFNLWSFGSKCWTIYICYKHSVAATFIMASIRVAVAYLSRFIVLFIIILINH